VTPFIASAMACVDFNVCTIPRKEKQHVRIHYLGLPRQKLIYRVKKTIYHTKTASITSESGKSAQVQCSQILQIANHNFDLLSLHNSGHKQAY
jgi:hypothetical protein